MPGAMSEQNLDDFEKILGHSFSDPGLLEQALTHPSLSSRPNYQRLEFIGDRVLGLVVAHMLFDAFPELDEGGMALRFNSLVRRETLAEVALELDIPRFVRVSVGEAAGGGRQRPAILADVLEAVIAALYLDAGLESAGALIRRCLGERITTGETATKDAKTALQELVQGRGAVVPVYREVSRSGPDHAPSFVISVTVEGHSPAEAAGPSKRRAEQAAAQAMLARLANADGANGG